MSCGFSETHARPDTTEWSGFAGNTTQVAQDKGVVTSNDTENKLEVNNENLTTDSRGKKLSSTLETE